MTTSCHLGEEINLLDIYPAANRDYNARAALKTHEVLCIAKKFGKDFFDGERIYGYGGYKYDGRWVAVAERMREHYHLTPSSKILDVGSGKGFLLHDFLDVLPGCTVAGLDISSYAIENTMERVKPFCQVGNAKDLPFQDNSFDLVISINTVHNLPRHECKRALTEIQRVSKGAAFITVDAWRNALEHENLEKWVLTAETYMHVDNWKILFEEAGYTGDYWWFIAN